ncbi:MAG TPA: amidohydrolase family protein [Thermoplasmata archaeon]|nr:amidohydrolase family protein [Thermoplasmata archaeon]
MIVEGAVVDADGPHRAYVRFRGGRVVEVGVPGTDSTRGRVKRLRGIVTPPPVNGHTHLGDAVATREPPHQPLAELVRPPHGYKFRLLATTPRREKIAAMRRALLRMRAEGVAATIDFREEGLDGIADLKRAARGTGVHPVILGRTLRRPVDPSELDRVLREADGIGLSAAREEPPAVRRLVARACRRRGRFFAMHASEEVREDPDDYLRPRPDLLVHLTKATADDLERVARAKVAVAVCPRSNALFGRRPDLAAFERFGVRGLLGTDNVMFHSPSIWRELEFAYVSARFAGRPVGPAYLARMAFVHPWEWLGRPECARVAPTMPVTPTVLRLPAEDPAYQLVSRGTEHLMVRPGTPDRRW